MINDWLQLWLKGPIDTVSDFIESKKIDGFLPHDLLAVGPALAYEQIGTDDYDMPIYELIPNQPGIWVFSLRNGFLPVADELKALEECEVFDDCTIEEMRENNQDYCLCGGIPYVQ